jgi:hypothetical protein
MGFDDLIIGFYNLKNRLSKLATDSHRFENAPWEQALGGAAVRRAGSFVLYVKEIDGHVIVTITDDKDVTHHYP